VTYGLLAVDILDVVIVLKNNAEYYDQAIDLAGMHGYLNDEALCSERAADFYKNRGQLRLAETCCREAYRLYHVWGAKAKTDDLLARYPHWVGDLSYGADRMHDEKLDAMIKVSQTFSEVAIVGDMLAQMLKIVMENAGAGRGRTGSTPPG